MRELLDAWELDYFSFVAGVAWGTVFCVVSWSVCVLVGMLQRRDRLQKRRARRVLTQRKW